MRAPPSRRTSAAAARFGVLAAAAVAIAIGCTRDDPNKLTGESGGTSTGAGCPSTSTSVTTGASSGSTGAGGAAPVHTVLDDRVLSYTEALRTASFKLVGDAPSLEDIQALANDPDPKTKYAAMIDAMMKDVRFARRMIELWKNTMRMGGPASGPKPSRDTAPTFAARITFEGQSYMNLFTASSNTCPTFDGTQFVDGSCQNGPITAGILTDPGVHAQYYSNLAMRRNRFFQETFACKKQPAELSAMPVPMGAGSYTSPWPFASIAGTANGGRIDFLDTTSAICANCHSTSNHRAPLFANFDENGQYQPDIAVHIPTAGTPLAQLGDWLPPGETTAWKFGVPAADLAALGAAMAADEEVADCAVARVWNYAMSKGDAVIDAAAVPSSVVGPLIKQFKASNYNLRGVIQAAFTHDDFVRF